MSRKVLRTESYEVAYGLDHALGYFVTVYDRNATDVDEEIIEDADMLFDGRGRVIEIMEKFGVPVDVIDNVVLDQPI